MKFTILLRSEDDSIAPLIVSKIVRTGPLKAATLGLTLAESKQLLARIQQEIVESQLNCHTEEQRISYGASIRTNRIVLLSNNITYNLFVQWPM